MDQPPSASKSPAWSLVLLAALAVFSARCGKPAGKESLAVASPDGRLTVGLELKTLPQPYLPGERAYYRVAYKGQPVLTDSPLGLDFHGARPLDRDFEVVGTDRQSRDGSWDNPFGVKRTVPDRYNELTVRLKEREAPGRRVDLIFRAYDEGVAFRYFLPEQDTLAKFILASENTGFYFAGDGAAYALNMGRFDSHYEAEFPRIGLAEIKPATLIALPLLVETTAGPWAALLEADLTDYAGLYVGGVPGVANGLTSRLSPLPRTDRPGGRRRDSQGHPVARADGRPDARQPCPEQLSRPQPERALRPGRYLLDQTGQGRLGLVVRQLRPERRLHAGHEHGDHGALHRLRRRARHRIHAHRRRLVRHVARFGE